MKTKVFTKWLFRSIAAFGVIIFIGSCDSFNFLKNKPSKNLTFENEIEVANQTIPASGGTITVNAPGNPVDGLSITVPVGSYYQSKDFKISTATITGNLLGEYFNPITPLIQIENGGGYSDSIMEVTIPIDLPEGHFAMGFYYDEMTGRLEGLPIKSISPDSITVITRHFMSGTDLASELSGLKSSNIKINASANLIISSIDESILKGQTIISTGFKPGTDDWEFPNYGSYIANGGHCAGQSISAMWYYYEKKLEGESPLNSKYDELDNLWQDNPYGIRFCSVIQTDQAPGELFAILRQIRNMPNLHLLSWMSFAYSMLTTGSPQYVGLTSLKGGHAIIAHKISLTDNILYVSDPNYPGQERQIKFVDSKFEPYNTKQNSNEVDSSEYTGVGYTAVSALVNWNEISSRWKEFENKTIGQFQFPAYNLFTVGKPADIALTDGMSVEKDTITIYCQSDNCDQFIKNTKNYQKIWINDDAGKIIAIADFDSKGLANFKLKRGANKIGVLVFGARDNKSENFVDFKWFTIYFSKLKIDPNPIAGEPKEDISITARSEGTAPGDAKYVWDFGDGSTKTTVKNDSIVSHKFQKEGIFDVVVELYDNATNKIVGRATAVANISNGLNKLQKCKYVSIIFNADIRSTSLLTTFSSLNINNAPTLVMKCPLVWNGTTFNVTYDYDFSDQFDIMKGRRTGTISGTMSADWLTINTFTAHETRKYENNISTEINHISVSNIPYLFDQGTSPRFGVEDSTVQQKISEFSMSTIYQDETQSMYSTEVYYNSPYDEPFLYIDFYQPDNFY